MNLTLYSDYALRVLMYLHADADNPSPITIQRIADAYGISKTHLMKVVNDLSRLGYVAASRGRGGGLRLAKAAEAINLGEVVRAMEPHFNLVECFGEDNHCPIVPACGLRGALLQARGAFMEVLDGYDLDDLAPRKRLLRKLWGASATASG